MERGSAPRGTETDAPRAAISKLVEEVVAVFGRGDEGGFLGDIGEIGSAGAEVCRVS